MNFFSKSILITSTGQKTYFPWVLSKNSDWNPWKLVSKNLCLSAISSSEGPYFEPNFTRILFANLDNKSRWSLIFSNSWSYWVKSITKESNNSNSKFDCAWSIYSKISAMPSTSFSGCEILRFFIFLKWIPSSLCKSLYSITRMSKVSSSILFWVFFKNLSSP